MAQLIDHVAFKLMLVKGTLDMPKALPAKAVLPEKVTQNHGAVSEDAKSPWVVV
jgi:hypothetical protein